MYALAKTGDPAGARSELSKLDALPHPYPLLPNLHAFVDKAPARPSLDGGVAANVPHFALSALPRQSTAVPTSGGGDGTDVPTGALGAAQQAIHKGDWNHARQIYEALVSRNPSDSEALAALGDVARAQGDSAGAIAAYRRALAVNPSYLPALLGMADTEWSSGDRAGAQKAYKDIEERFPGGDVSVLREDPRRARCGTGVDPHRGPVFDGSSSPPSDTPPAPQGASSGGL